MGRSPASEALQTQQGCMDASLSPRALGAFSVGQEHIKSAPETGEAMGEVTREREQSPTGHKHWVPGILGLQPSSTRSRDSGWGLLPLWFPSVSLPSVG